MNAEVQEDQAHEGIARKAHPDLQDGTPRMRKRMTMWEEWCLKPKRKQKQPGKEPKILCRKQSGKGTPVP